MRTPPDHGYSIFHGLVNAALGPGGSAVGGKAGQGQSGLGPLKPVPGLSDLGRGGKKAAPYRA